MLSEPSAFTQKNECTSVLLFLCFVFVFTLLFHSSHSHLSHLNRYHGVVANIGGMGERKTSFSSMPPATKKVWEPCPRAKLDVTFCAHVCFDLSFDLCFLFCLLQPKKKGPANPRSKGAWIKAEDQKVLSRLLLLLEMLESMTCSLLHVFLLQLKKAIEQHGMGSWQTISKYEVLDSFLRVFFQITSSRAPFIFREVQARTAEQCRVWCRSISSLNPDKKKDTFNEVWDPP